MKKKITERRGYIPQACKLRFFGAWNKRQELVWHNIIHEYGNTFGLSKAITESYPTEESALKIIEDYKNEDVIKESNKVKSITYKMVD